MVAPGQNNLKDLGITVAAGFRLACLAKCFVANTAFADWSLSDEPVNLAKWWTDERQRLEHGHRPPVETVERMAAAVCARAWRSSWAVPFASVSSAVLAGAGLLASVVWLSLRASIRAECEEGAQ